MWAFSEKEDLRRFADRRDIISVLVDDGFGLEEVSIFIRLKLGFDRAMKHRWHVLVPFSDHQLTTDFEFGSGCYNVELAHQILNDFSIQTNGLPALAFPDPKDNGKVFTVALGGLNHVEIRNVTRGIAGIVNRPRPTYGSVLEYKQDILDEIRAYAAGKGVLGSAASVGRGATGVIGIVANLMQVFGDGPGG